MEAIICLVDAWCIIVEELAVAIYRVDSKAPCAVVGVDRAIEVVGCDELHILTCGHYVSEVVVAVVEELVVLHDGV